MSPFTIYNTITTRPCFSGHVSMLWSDVDPDPHSLGSRGIKWRGKQSSTNKVFVCFFVGNYHFQSEPKKVANDLRYRYRFDFFGVIRRKEVIKKSYYFSVLGRIQSLIRFSFKNPGSNPTLKKDHNSDSGFEKMTRPEGRVPKKILTQNVLPNFFAIFEYCVRNTDEKCRLI